MIQRVYIVCNKQDYYFAKVSVASIRHWNKTIPVTLIKDETFGSFSTIELEKYFDVSIAKTALKKMGFYVKLWPFFEAQSQERIMILDADIVWMCDMAELLKDETADLLVDGYNPAKLEVEMDKWYFNKNKLLEKIPKYQYPGFLFNVGQMVINTAIFNANDFAEFLEWKENPVPKTSGIFFHEQGILNAMVAEKIRQKQITVTHTSMHRWGWTEEVQRLKKEDLSNGVPFLIHWYGYKHGLFSILPGADILLAYEKKYFLKIRKPLLFWYGARFLRTLKKPHRYAWHIFKQILGKK